MSKIRINEVVKKALGLYKANSRTLLRISGIQVMISYGVVILSGVAALISKERVVLSLLVTLFRLLTVLLAVYFTNRVYTSLILAIKQCYNGSKGNVGCYYREAGMVVWRYIGYRLLLGLMYAVPLCIGIIGWALSMVDGFEFPIFISVILYFIGGILALILMTLFYFVLVTAVLYRYPKSIWGYSIKLLKGNLFPIFILVLIGCIQPLYPWIFATLFNIEVLNFGGQAVFYLLEMIPIWLSTPFFVSLTIVSMQMIEECNQKTFADGREKTKNEEKREFDYLQ